jgi:hypothetical protein
VPAALAPLKNKIMLMESHPGAYIPLLFYFRSSSNDSNVDQWSDSDQHFRCKYSFLV